uniref:Secreted protein n=1 Tax=Trichobilharzia regenti TaxID=157069 RepID=A0AA85KE81_TRIRE|nr:unnamed protein product [Trichobilharzia regenti]
MKQILFVLLLVSGINYLQAGPVLEWLQSFGGSGDVKNRENVPTASGMGDDNEQRRINTDGGSPYVKNSENVPMTSGTANEMEQRRIECMSLLI